MSFAYVSGIFEAKPPENSTNGKPAIPNGQARIANGLFLGFNGLPNRLQIDEFLFKGVGLGIAWAKFRSELPLTIKKKQHPP
jgi:hypothetical protein